MADPYKVELISRVDRTAQTVIVVSLGENAWTAQDSNMFAAGGGASEYQQGKTILRTIGNGPPGTIVLSGFPAREGVGGDGAKNFANGEFPEGELSWIVHQQ